MIKFNEKFECTYANVVCYELNCKVMEVSYSSYCLFRHSCVLPPVASKRALHLLLLA